MAKCQVLRDSDFSNFGDRSYENGVLKLALASWRDFLEMCQIFAETGTDYIWRGHQDQKWELKSYFDRACSKNLEFLSDRQGKLDDMLAKFKERLTQLRHARVDEMTDDEIWAIGQHYGLPTPLLDWTECPYIAAFMAFRKTPTEDQSEYRVVYALNKALETLLRRTKIKEKCTRTRKVVSSTVCRKDRFIEFLDLAKTSDATQNARLCGQKGRFTKALDGIRIEAGVSDFVKHCPEVLEAGEVILAETLIPDQERPKCLDWLRKEKDINHGTMFPDYPGAVEACRDDLGMLERSHN